MTVSDKANVRHDFLALEQMVGLRSEKLNRNFAHFPKGH
jgi:hypothetical protein